MLMPTILVALVLAQAPQTTSPAAVASAQDARQRLRVFLDCGDCFAEYLRSEISWVDFVRNREDADLQLLSTSNDTGGGGREVVLRFVGVGRFEGVERQLRARSLTGDPEDARRRSVFRTVTVGLLAYMAEEGLPQDLGLTVRPPNATPAGAAPRRDPWNAWVFSVRGGGSFDAEESNRQTNWDARVGADRVTAGWILSFGGRLEEEVEHFDLDEDEPLKAIRRERSVDWFFARSLGPRLSAGLDGDMEASTFGNTKFSVGFAPAIEFNLFPYSDYATRQFRLQYSVGSMHARYNEVTLYGQLQETRPRQQASATLEQRQPWGSLQAGVDVSQYLHDRSKYNVEVNGEVSLRLARGLSMNFEGSASRIRDQLSLPARGATPEEVLLRLRELQSGYEVGAQISLTYT